MPNTIGNINFIGKILEKQLIEEVQSELYFTRKGMLGSSDNKIIQVRPDFTRKAADKMTIGLVMKLAGIGVTGDNEIEGKEEEMTVHDFSFMIDQVRNGIRLKGRMDEKKIVYNMRTSAKSALKTWLLEYIEHDIFYKLCGVTGQAFANTPTAPSSGRLLYGGNATSTSTIDATDKFAPTDISKAKVLAETVVPKIRPLRIDGHDRYVMLIHPYQAFDLSQNVKWNQAQQTAGIRGFMNPIFSGALGMWDGVIIHAHEYIDHVSTWGAAGNVEGATALLLGRQAGVIGFGESLRWYEKEFDAGNKQAFYCGRIFGCDKTKFNGQDFATVSVRTAAAKPF